MDFLTLLEKVGPESIMAGLVVFLIWNNAKLIDRIIEKLITNGNNKNK